MADLKASFGKMAVFFYNEYAPNVIALLWRPDAFQTHPFSVANAEYKRPVLENNEDSLLITNADDIVREVENMSQDVVVDIRTLEKNVSSSGNRVKRKASDLDERD